jgi:serpin B
VTLQGGVDEGWVAVADHDGTPWVALAEDPTPGFELASVQVDRPNPTKAAARTAATSVNAFGIDLYKRVLRDPSLDLGGKGVVLSPTSIAIALAMARAGARGTTASEMDAVLHTSGWDAFGTQLGALQQRLASRDAAWTDEEGETHALSLRIANAAFAQDGWPIEQPYLREIGLALGAALGLVDYVNDAGGALRAINGWVARQTANRIPNLLVPPNVRPTTRLVLVNAIYLKANWQTEFGRGHATRDRAFHRADGSVVEVPTMQLAGDQKVPYATGKGWKATELRYLGADGTTPLAMTIVMPDDLAAWERSLTPAKLAAVDSRLRQERARLQKVSYGPMPEDCGTYPYSLRLFMPRFGIDTKGDLVPALEALGIRAAVDSAQANFNGITPGGRLFIAAVIHEANIDVDEKGTEAAAATAIVMDTGGCTGPGPARTVTLRLDRPFLYFVRDLETGAIVFMGRVMDPSVRS